MKLTTLIIGLVTFGFRQHHIVPKGTGGAQRKAKTGDQYIQAAASTGPIGEHIEQCGTAGAMAFHQTQDCWHLTDKYSPLIRGWKQKLKTTGGRRRVITKQIICHWYYSPSDHSTQIEFLRIKRY